MGVVASQEQPCLQPLFEVVQEKRGLARQSVRQRCEQEGKRKEVLIWRKEFLIWEESEGILLILHRTDCATDIRRRTQ